jgi:multiple sugar transport system permease protein
MSTPSVIESRDDVRLTRPVPRLRRRVGAAAARRRLALALCAPAALFMLLVHGLPALGGLYLSFKQLNTFTFALLFNAPSAGIRNYTALFDANSPLRPGFFGAIRNTAVYTFVTVGGTLVGGMALALLVNRPIRGQRLIRTLMLTPWIVPSFVVALLWRFMWQSDVGIINKILVDYTGLLGHRPVWLLGDASLWAIIVPSVWRGLPFAMLIFFAGLQAIPPELHEAAAIDGAGPWRRFRHITLPLMRPLIAIQLLFGVIYAAYQYAIPVVMLGSTPGPNADLLMTLIVRQSFQNNLFGFGAAASVLLTLVMLIWVAVWWRIFRRDLEGAA